MQKSFITEMKRIRTSMSLALIHLDHLLNKNQQLTKDLQFANCEKEVKTNG